jgi:Carboxypeptidase regulatory-like domain/TonB dependent receptor-like, beta-barrel
MILRITRTVQALPLVVLAAIVMSAPVCAQEARGTITGTVRDASKAVVPGATVRITNVAMGTTVSSVTNEGGLFQALYLIPGNYQIVVEVIGFKKYIRDGIVVRVNDTIGIDIDLEIGAVEQTVTVTADASALETTSASIGQVVDSRRIAELPIGHGDPYALIGLSGGVSFTRSQRLDRPFEPTHIVGYTMDGTRANRSDLTIDGVASTATANAMEVISSYVPPQDLVQEFKVQTATFDASQGNTEGGVINLSIKSGTNQFHGTVAYSNFTPGTSANDFWANRAGQPLADFYYHRFGGTVGGPVWIPKVYKGENRTFFMYGMEGIREARPRNNGTTNIPTERMRTGDFSELLVPSLNPGNAAIHPYQLFNPFSAQRVGQRIQRDPFRCDSAGNPLAPLANKTQPAGTPCNKIPASLINPIARNFVDNYLPLPTSSPTAPTGAGNFAQPGLTEAPIYYSHTIRIDHVFNDRHRTFGRASWYDRDSEYNNYYGNLATGTIFQFVSRQGVLDHVYTMNPTTVFNIRYGYNRFIRVDNTNPENHGFDLTTLGFPASYANLIPEDIRRFPRFNFDGGVDGYQGTGFGADYRPNDTHSFVGQVNKSLGNHALKTGVEFRAYRENSIPTGNNQSGEFTFNNNFTKGPLDNVNAPSQLGFSFAALLLGIPSTGSINQPTNYAETSTTWGVYVHNDWKVNSRLTLNLGLRWEMEGALTERYNRSVRGFDTNVIQPIEAAARAAYAASQATNPTPEVPVDQFRVRGGLTFAGVNGEPRELYRTPKQNLMPRIGLAYQLNEKTVLRAGYGIFYGFLGQRRGDVIQSGFSTTTPMVITLDNGVTFQETLSNPFSNGLATIPGASQGIETFLGRSLGAGTGGNPIAGFFNSAPDSPYMQRWQLGIQRELSKGVVLEIAYVGNRGTHIEIFRNINALPNQYLSTSTTRDQARINYLTANVPNPFANLPQVDPGHRAANIQRHRLLRPFPHFQEVWATTNEGYSWYHSLQLDLEKRFSRGFTLQMNYTFSKFMEATTLLNHGDPRPTEMISDNDRPHRLSISGIYELPFGKGRQFGANARAVVSHIISGWQVSGIYAFQSGPPIDFAPNVAGANFPGGPLFTGDVKNIRLPGDQQAPERWINTDAGFNKVAEQQLDWNLRTFPIRFGFIRADKISNFDIGIIKKTFIGEKKEAQFRAELLNAFNHPLLFTNTINTNPVQSTFGRLTSQTQENYPRRVQLTFKFVF